jgi:hypothetical protein
MKKQIIIGTILLVASIFNAPLTAANNTPTPEVIECEKNGTCEMTPLEKLQGAKGKKIEKNNKFSNIIPVNIEKRLFTS